MTKEEQTRLFAIFLRSANRTSIQIFGNNERVIVRQYTTQELYNQFIEQQNK